MFMISLLCRYIIVFVSAAAAAPNANEFNDDDDFFVVVIVIMHFFSPLLSLFGRHTHTHTSNFAKIKFMVFGLCSSTCTSQNERTLKLYTSCSCTSVKLSGTVDTEETLTNHIE